MIQVVGGGMERASVTKVKINKIRKTLLPFSFFFFFFSIFFYLGSLSLVEGAREINSSEENDQISALQKALWRSRLINDGNTRPSARHWPPSPPAFGGAAALNFVWFPRTCIIYYALLSFVYTGFAVVQRFR